MRSVRFRALLCLSEQFLTMAAFATVVTLFFLFSAVAYCQRNGTRKEPDPKQIKEWMSAESDFYHLEQQLQKALGDDWDSFRLYMTEKIQEHHNSQVSCQATPNAESVRPPYDDCQGQAGLTESEYILHQALDLYSDKISHGDMSVLHRYHNMAHNVFERTRKLLEKMSLLQGSEYEDPAVAKQNDMRYRYKRLTPIAPANSSQKNVKN